MFVVYLLLKYPAKKSKTEEKQKKKNQKKNNKKKDKKCYITYDMDFRFVPSDLVFFDKLSHCDL